MHDAESCPDVESGSAERVVEAHVAGMGLAVREMVGLMEQHFGTEVKVKKRFQDHRDDLLRHADDLVAALARLWSSRSSSSMNQPASHHQVAVATTTTTTTSTSASLPVERLLADLDDLELKKSRKRVPVVEAETTQQWAATLLAQMTALTPATADPASSAGHDEAEVGGVEAEGEEEAPDGDDEIDLEQEQAEAAQFMANAEEGVRQLNEVSALTDPDVMDVDDFDEDKFKTRVKVFFDTNKKTLLYLRKKSKQTVRPLSSVCRCACACAAVRVQNWTNARVLTGEGASAVHAPRPPSEEAGRRFARTPGDGGRVQEHAHRCGHPPPLPFSA